VQPFAFLQRGSNQATETPVIASDEDVLSLLLEQHDLFLSSTRSRLTKLQVSKALNHLV
jgi:katanin p80 WD40 repeat-containing subunit B1